MTPWREVKQLVDLIADDRREERKFQAALHGVELEDERAPGVFGPGNDAWQRAMAIKRERKR